MADLKTELRRFIEENFLLGAPGLSFADNDSFIELHILDSTGFLEVISHLEATYHIAVADEEMVPENLDSLDHLVAFTERKRARGRRQ